MQNTRYNAQQIFDDLASGDNERIRSAAFAAGDMRLEAAIPMLSSQLANENLGVQEGAEYALRHIRGPQAVDAILPLLRSEEASIRNVSMDILREIGADNMESMHTWLHDPDADLRIFITDILGHSTDRRAGALLCEALLKDPEVNVRYQAAVSLGNLAFPETVPSLCRAVRDEEWVQFAAVEALTKIRDETTLAALANILPDASPLVASAIIDALGSMGNVKTIPLLFKSLENVSVALRHKTVKAIVQILGGQSLSMLSPKLQERLRVYLLDALTDSDEDILMAALQGASFMGHEEASRAVLALAARLDPEADVNLYETAIRTVASIGYNDVIKEALRSGDEDRIVIAMEACQLMDDHRPVEELKAIFWELDVDLQRAAAAEIAQLGSEADIDFFKNLMNQAEDSEMLKSAIIFFGNQHGLDEAEDVVFAQLGHRYVDVKEMALEACINLHSEHLNERFRSLARNGEDMERMMAVYALGRYDVTENLAEITEALEDQSPNVRQMAVEAFLNLGMDAEQHLPCLLPRMYDENKNVRIALVNLLGQIGTPAVISRLMTALHDENDWVRIRAVEALGANRAVEAVPAMASLLEHASPVLAFKIIEVLGKIGGNAAFSVLLGMMDHPDPEIQHAAAEAVAAIKAEQE